MNLKEYAQAKFALASILRSVEPLMLPTSGTGENPVRALFGLLADDRFNIAVSGRHGSGKTSLVNAMLGVTLLPVGVPPVASVATSVVYGTSGRALVEYDHARRSVSIDNRELPEFFARLDNPDNSHNVRMMHVQIPSELLRRGFHFMDAPGPNASGPDAPDVREDSRAPEADWQAAYAHLVVMSHDESFSEEDLRWLRNGADAAGGLFLAVNKHDLIPVPEQDKNLACARHLLSEVQADPLRAFSVSARQAIAATAQRDAQQWEASGVPTLLNSLERFMTERGRVNFLDRMCARISSLLAETPRAEHALQQIQEVRQRLEQDATSPEEGSAASMPERSDTFFSCAVCRRMEQEITGYLHSFQSTGGADENVRASFVAHGGFCTFHAWLYQSMASPRGVCLTYPDVLERHAARLRELANSTGEDVAGALAGDLSHVDSCGVCQVKASAEQKAVQELRDSLHRNPGVAPEVCMPHFLLLLQRVNDKPLVRRLLRMQADRLDRLAEDMQSYTIKLDGLRRALITKEEEHACLRGLVSLAGHPGITGPPRRR